MIPTPKNRYKMTVQHEVIIYADDEKEARRNLLNSPNMRGRVNLKCVEIAWIPMPDKEVQTPVIDERRAPGS